jgi:hypothetical protein
MFHYPSSADTETCQIQRDVRVLILINPWHFLGNIQLRESFYSNLHALVNSILRLRLSDFFQRAQSSIHGGSARVRNRVRRRVAHCIVALWPGSESFTLWDGSVSFTLWDESVSFVLLDESVSFVLWDGSVRIRGDAEGDLANRPA